MSPSSTQLSPSAFATSRLVDMSTLKSLHIWDGHCYLMGFEGSTPAERMQSILRYDDRMGIEKMCLFLGMEFKFHEGPEAMRKQNDEVMEAVKHSQGRALGYAFMDPYYVDACLDEMNRCIRDGPLVGLKFEFDTPALANSPELDPIIARAGELKAVVLHHTYIKTTG
jgi:predicted TIM-barrel fold metal-dependent hydrolase